MARRYLSRKRFFATILLPLCLAVITSGAPRSVRADITCYDFNSPAEVQAIANALPNDPFGLDVGWPLPDGLGGGDQEASNGFACDATKDIPELKTPGDEDYHVGKDAAKNGLETLPDVELEKATIREAQYAGAIQTEENPDVLYVLMGIATPEYEVYADYEGHDIPGQCGSAETTARLQELLAPGTTVWLEIDEAGFYTKNELDRQVWIKLDDRYRLVSEVLVSEGHAVVATDRPGTGRGDARTDPPPGARYRNALRRAQERAVSNHVGLWGQCVTT